MKFLTKLIDIHTIYIFVMLFVMWFSIVLVFSEYSTLEEKNKEQDLTISRGCFQAQSRYCTDAAGQLWDLK